MPYLNAVAASCVDNHSLQVGGIGKGSQLRQPTQLYGLIDLGHLWGGSCKPKWPYHHGHTE